MKADNGFIGLIEGDKFESKGEVAGVPVSVEAGFENQMLFEGFLIDSGWVYIGDFD